MDYYAPIPIYHNRHSFEQSTQEPTPWSFITAIPGSQVQLRDYDFWTPRTHVTGEKPLCHRRNVSSASIRNSASPPVRLLSRETQPKVCQGELELFICPSTSPAALGFYFVEQKDCVFDYVLTLDASEVSRSFTLTPYPWFPLPWNNSEKHTSSLSLTCEVSTISSRSGRDANLNANSIYTKLTSLSTILAGRGWKWTAAKSKS